MCVIKRFVNFANVKTVQLCLTRNKRALLEHEKVESCVIVKSNLVLSRPTHLRKTLPKAHRTQGIDALNFVDFLSQSKSQVKLQLVLFGKGQDIQRLDFLTAPPPSCLLFSSGINLAFVLFRQQQPGYFLFRQQQYGFCFASAIKTWPLFCYKANNYFMVLTI